jgi:hypothetical protein
MLNPGSLPPILGSLPARQLSHLWELIILATHAQQVGPLKSQTPAHPTMYQHNISSSLMAQLHKITLQTELQTLPLRLSTTPRMKLSSPTSSIPSLVVLHTLHLISTTQESLVLRSLCLNFKPTHYSKLLLVLSPSMIPTLFLQPVARSAPKRQTNTVLVSTSP